MVPVDRPAPACRAHHSVGYQQAQICDADRHQASQNQAYAQGGVGRGQLRRWRHLAEGRAPLRAAEDEEENRGQYEFPEVEKALPECIQKTLKRDSSDWRVHDRELLRRFRTGKFNPWIERLRRIQRLSRLPLKQSRDYVEAGYYDEPPLPSLLVTFKEHDAITACFDEEGQYMMEGTAEPTVCFVFSPRNADDVRHALRIVERFVALNYELFQLVEDVQGWEKRHAGACVDRGEPSLRAA